MPSTGHRSIRDQKATQESGGQNDMQLQNQLDVRGALRVLKEIGYVRLEAASGAGARFVTDQNLSSSMSLASASHEVRSLREEFWGNADPENPEIFQIGMWGKILALLALRSAASSMDRQESSMRSTKFAQAVLSSWNARAKKTKAAIKLEEEVHKEPVTQLFQIRGNPKRKFQKSYGRHYFQAVAWFCASQIATHPKAGITVSQDPEHLFAILVDAADGHASEPEAFFWKLCDKLDIKAVIEGLVRPSEGLIDAQLYSPRDLRDVGAEPTISSIAVRIIDDFCKTASRPERILGLKGNPHAGKKAVVTELIELLAGVTGQAPAFSCRDNAEQLPVIGIDVRMRNYGELIQTVHKRLLAAARTPEEDTHSDVAELLRCIAELHKRQAALFIFVDVDGFGHSDPRRILQKRGFRRLLTTLRDSNSASRFLLTTSEPEAFDSDAVLRGKVKWIDVPDPTVERLQWYLTKEGAERLVKSIKEARLPDHRQQVSGDGLVAIAALEPINGSAFELEFLPTLSIYIRETKEKSLMKGVEFAFDQLVNLVHLNGILPSLTLISLSYDGLGEYSLRRCLEWWAEQVPSDHAVDPTSEEGYNSILEQLISLHETARRLILQFGPSVNYEPDEFGFGEPVTLYSDGKPKTWSVHANVSREFLRAVLRRQTDNFDGAEFIRHCQRTIAFAARRRAQFKKMRSKTDDPFFANSGTGRDVQSFVALLGSIEWAAMKSEPREALSPAHHLRRIFSIDRMFSPRMAFVFGVQSILKHDIDFDNRLSMVTDQDTLRLRLYLLPFACASGTISEPVTARALMETKSVDPESLDVPDLLKEVLGVETVVALLSTVAITSFYCLDAKKLAWAAERLIEIDEGDEEARERALIRTYLAMIDLSIQLGNWPFRDMDEKLFGPNRNYSVGFEGIAQRIPEIFARLWGARLENPPEVKEYKLKVWARFKIREIEVKWHLGEDPSAGIRNLLHYEDRASTLKPIGEPQLVTGRSARKLIRIAANDFPIWSPACAGQPDVSFSELIKSLLEANISRLVRFAGAERVGVLLDQARLYLLEKEPLQRVQFALSEAWDRADNGSISSSMRLELMALDAAVSLIDFELQRKLGNLSVKVAIERAALAKETLSSLHELARSLGIRPLELAARNLGRMWFQAMRVVQSSEKPAFWPGGDESALQVSAALREIGMFRVAAIVSEG